MWSKNDFVTLVVAFAPTKGLGNELSTCHYSYLINQVSQAVTKLCTFMGLSSLLEVREDSQTLRSFKKMSVTLTKLKNITCNIHLEIYVVFCCRTAVHTRVFDLC